MHFVYFLEKILYTQCRVYHFILCVMKLFQKSRSIKGSVLVFSLIILAFMLVSALSVAMISVTEKRASLATDKSSRSFQMADTGVELVLQKIYGTTTYTDLNALATALGGGFTCNTGEITKSGVGYAVTFLTSANTPIGCSIPTWRSDVAKIKSEGTAGNTKRAVEVGVRSANYNIISQVAYTTPGTYSWIAPAGVTSVSVFVVGGGGGGGYGGNGNYGGTGGGGGGSSYGNNITVVPGNSYTIIVGAGGVAGRQYDFGYPGNASSGFGVSANGGGGGETSYLWVDGNPYYASNNLFVGVGGFGTYVNGGNGGSDDGVGNGDNPPGGTGGTSNGTTYGTGGYGGGDGAGNTWPGAGSGGTVRIIWPGTTRQFPSTGTADQ